MNIRRQIAAYEIRINAIEPNLNDYEKSVEAHEMIVNELERAVLNNKSDGPIYRRTKASLLDAYNQRLRLKNILIHYRTLRADYQERIRVI